MQCLRKFRTKLDKYIFPISDTSLLDINRGLVYINKGLMLKQLVVTDHSYSARFYLPPGRANNLCNIHASMIV